MNFITPPQLDDILGKFVGSMESSESDEEHGRTCEDESESDEEHGRIHIPPFSSDEFQRSHDLIDSWQLAV